MAKKKKKILLIILGILLSLIVIFVTTILITFNNISGKFKKETVKQEDLGINKEEISKYDSSSEITNIALFGIDSTDDKSGRSDTIMLATLDTVHNKLKLTSFMRDSYVAIEGHGDDKINHAYAFGGPTLALNTLNTNFGLNVDKFITVDFTSLPKIIDRLNGIDINIKDYEITSINSAINNVNKLTNSNSELISKAGTQHLNGVQALAYSRVRHAGNGDFERTERQRTVLTAVFNKAINIPVTDYYSILSDISSEITTNITATDLLSLSTKVASLGISGVSIEQERYPRDNECSGTMINGVYYLTFNRESTKQSVMEYIFNDKK